MTDVLGIIAEYNPFHNGHKWQIEKAKSMFGDCPVLTIMSGHFTQRGCPALLDKWQRAEMAVHGGADLVLELPFISACKSAEFFATGAVKILNEAGIVSHLCFGSETGDIATLQKTAQITTTSEFRQNLKQHLKAGLTYAAAIEQSLSEHLGELFPDFLGPNNILAVEYIKALEAIGSSIKPVAIARKTAQHLDKEIKSDIASATAIRSNISSGRLDGAILQTMPEASRQIILQAQQRQELLSDYSTFNQLLFYRLRQLTPEQIASIADISEGLQYRIKKAAQKAATFDELLTLASSKRYPKTRIMRIFCQLLVLDGNPPESQAPYFRILAFNKRGRDLIKKIRSQTVFPLITNLPDLYTKLDSKTRHSLDADIKATDTFQIMLGKNQSGLDFKKMPTYIDK